MTIIDLTMRDVIETPFAHVRNSAFVAPQAYEVLRRTFPECPPGDGPSGYSLWAGDDRYQGLLAAHHEWRALHDTFHSQAFIDWAIAQFADVWERQGCRIDLGKARFVPYREDGIDKVRRHMRKIELAPNELWVRMDINQGQVGYSRPIHRDWPRRLVSMLVYMCDHTESAAEGGELMLHPVPWKRWTQQPVVVTPRENLMVAFPCSARSYHSVPRISSIARPRNYLQVLISSSVDAWTHRDPKGRAVAVLGSGARKTRQLLGATRETAKPGGAADREPNFFSGSGRSAARVLPSRGPFYFAWGCFRDFLSRPCGAPPKRRCTASGTRDRAYGGSIQLQAIMR